MDVSAVKNATAHRPWPMPNRPWVMTQIWHDLLFLHWPLDPALIAPLIPKPLTLDTFNDQAWVSLSPFLVTHAKPRFFPRMPLFSRFLELNVRTYVTYEDKPGIYFFSLDASNPVVAAAARLGYHLPYIYARMHCERKDGALHFESVRADAVFRAVYQPVGEPFFATPGSRDHWLVERYCLYTFNRRGTLFRGEIHHPPWPLQTAQAELREKRIGPVALPGPPMLAHFAGRLDVLVWLLQRVTSQ